MLSKKSIGFLGTLKYNDVSMETPPTNKTPSLLTVAAWEYPHLTPPLCQNGTKSGTCSGQLFQDRSGPRHFGGVCILGLGLGLVLVLVLGVWVRVSFFGSSRLRGGVRFWLGPGTQLDTQNDAPDIMFL